MFFDLLPPNLKSEVNELLLNLRVYGKYIRNVGTWCHRATVHACYRYTTRHFAHAS